MPRTTRFATRGLTLIELLIVLAIIAALAGSIVPFLPDMTDRTQSATNASNLKELANTMQTYRAIRGKEAGRYDALLQGAAGDTLFSRLPKNTAGVIAGGHLAPYQLTAGDAAALSAAGMTHSYTMDDGTKAGFNATFDNLSGGLNLVATDAYVAQVVEVGAVEPLSKFGHFINPGDVFVCFGVGSACGLVGKDGGLTEAPVSYRPAVSPASVYCRYVVVYQTKEGATQLAKARFICVAALSGDGFENSDDFAKKYDTLLN